MVVVYIRVFLYINELSDFFYCSIRFTGLLTEQDSPSLASNHILYKLVDGLKAVMHMVSVKYSQCNNYYKYLIADANYTLTTSRKIK